MKEKVDYLLTDIRELERLVGGTRDAEIYPVSFFDQAFQLTHKILTELHGLEESQLETLRRQMEEHQRLIDSIPVSEPVRMPEARPVSESAPAIEIKQEQAPVIEPVAPAIEKPIPEEKAEKPGISLNDALEKRHLSDFRKAFSLNDRFRFRRELFGGDEEKMNKAIAELNDLGSYEESVAYLNQVLNWNIENASVADFIKLLEKRFS